MSRKIKFKEINQQPWNLILGLLGISHSKNKTLCPFHKDSHPSFHLYEPHGYCFVCNKRFSKIDFVMASTGLGIHDAVDFIAGNAISYIPKYQSKKNSRKRRLK